MLYHLDYWFYELFMSSLDICQIHHHDSSMRDVISIDQFECQDIFEDRGEHSIKPMGSCIPPAGVN